MKNKILDIWAIQLMPNELYTALKQIKSDVTIYENVICRFSIDGENLQNRQFDKVIYSEESDTLILLMRDGKATLDQAEKYFNENNIAYNKISFMDSIASYCDDSSIPEFWFARDPYVIEDALNDSLNKGISECMYNEDLTASLTLRYLSNNGKLYNLLKINFKGLIKLDDKIVLICHQKNKKNINSNEVCKILDKYKIQNTNTTPLSR